VAASISASDDAAWSLIRELQTRELQLVAGGFKTTEKSTGCECA
jgi:hypothetical protein